MTYIDDELSKEPEKERPGDRDDLNFLANDEWLMDTEVKPHITLHKGRWHVFMIYVSIHNPMQCLCRRIGDYESESKAKIYSEFFRRTIARDPRGTLKAPDHDIDLSDN